MKINSRKIVLLVAFFVLVMTVFSGCDLGEQSKDVDLQKSKDDYYKQLEGYVETIREKTDFKPDIAITLGSGLGDFAKAIDVEAEISFDEIPGFPHTTNKSHAGKFILGTIEGKKVVCMQGRIHYYEGYDMWDVVAPLRVCHMLGANTIILSNAVGAINSDFKVGDFMVSNDVITSFIPSTLRGANIDELGERFPDMSDVFDKELNNIVKKVGNENSINVHEGIYLQDQGPQYETPAEIKMYKQAGADTVGMSSACEAIAARHMNMKVCHINSITNMGAGLSKEKLSDDDILKNSNNVAKKFTILLKGLLKNMK